MRPVWLVEANVDGLSTTELQNAVRRRGISAHVVKPFLHAEPPHDILGAESIPYQAAAIFTGTLTLMRYIRSHRVWMPGGWCNFDDLACSTYYTYFGGHLLNRNYVMLPVAEAIRRQDWLFSRLGRDGRLFVRPDSVDKFFAGRVTDEQSFRPVIEKAAKIPTMMIVVAQPQLLRREWRVFVANGQVVTGSQYRVDGATQLSNEFPVEVRDYANQVLADVEWRPDPLFVLDICESVSGLKVVELNSYSCSGPCECDLDKYVDAALRAVEAF